MAIVHAKDPDGDGVTYAITGGNEDSNFELDNQKGESSGMQTQSSLLWYQRPGIRYNASGMLSLTRTSKAIKNVFPLPVCSARIFNPSFNSRLWYL